MNRKYELKNLDTGKKYICEIVFVKLNSGSYDDYKTYISEDEIKVGDSYYSNGLIFLCEDEERAQMLKACKHLGKKIIARGNPDSKLPKLVRQETTDEYFIEFANFCREYDEECNNNRVIDVKNTNELLSEWRSKKLITFYFR